jgi:hypothetical protein
LSEIYFGEKNLHREAQEIEIIREQSRVPLHSLSLSSPRPSPVSSVLTTGREGQESLSPSLFLSP